MSARRQHANNGMSAGGRPIRVPRSVTSVRAHLRRHLAEEGRRMQDLAPVWGCTKHNVYDPASPDLLTLEKSNYRLTYVRLHSGHSFLNRFFCRLQAAQIVVNLGLIESPCRINRRKIIQRHQRPSKVRDGATQLLQLALCWNYRIHQGRQESRHQLQCLASGDLRRVTLNGSYGFVYPAIGIEQPQHEMFALQRCLEDCTFSLSCLLPDELTEWKEHRQESSSRSHPSTHCGDGCPVQPAIGCGAQTWNHNFGDYHRVSSLRTDRHSATAVSCG